MKHKNPNPSKTPDVDLEERRRFLLLLSGGAAMAGAAPLLGPPERPQKVLSQVSKKRPPPAPGLGGEESQPREHPGPRCGATWCGRQPRSGALGRAPQSAARAPLDSFFQFPHSWSRFGLFSAQSRVLKQEVQVQIPWNGTVRFIPVADLNLVSGGDQFSEFFCISPTGARAGRNSDIY